MKAQLGLSLCCGLLVTRALGALALLSLLLVTGCSPSPSGPPEVLVIQDRPAEWADALKLGFADGLAANGIQPGRDVRIIHLSAAGEAQTLTSIALSVRAGQPALVFTLGTQASQAVFTAVKKTPMLFGAVTDPVAAGFYTHSLDRPAGNLTGTQDIWPYDAQFDLIRQLLPNLEKIGVLANPSEINTQVSVRHIRRAAAARAIQVVEKPVLNQSEVSAATAALLSAGVGAVFIPADNTVQAAASTIIASCNARRLPVFTGIPGIVENGALATVGTNYYELGRLNGELASRILTGEEARNIPVSVATRGDIYLNLTAARRLGIEIPSDVQARALKAYE